MKLPDSEVTCGTVAVVPREGYEKQLAHRMIGQHSDKHFCHSNSRFEAGSEVSLKDYG